VDDVDTYEQLCRFVRTVSERSGVAHFVVHARKCLLSGLSPHQNRTIPPLRCLPPAMPHAVARTN
jgi:tRNA-dihydrouridine synthase A